MTTLANLKSTIASDLHRNDMSDVIATEISNAIGFYAMEQFWFLEGTSDLTTVASQVWYDVPSDFGALVSRPMINVNGTKSPLNYEIYQELDSMDSSTYEGIPNKIAYFGNQFRFYPVPDSEYVVSLSYRKMLDAPTASGSNAWTSTAFDLIRYRAEKRIYGSRLRNPEMAGMASGFEKEELDSLLSDSTLKKSTGRLKKNS